MKRINIQELKGKIDFGIITIREDEYKSVLSYFGNKFFTEKNQRYIISELLCETGETYWIAITRCIEQGTGESQRVTNDFISDLEPEWLSIIGICGSVPDEEFTLGDVFLGTRLYDFSVEAVSDSKTNTYSLQGGAMHPKVQSLLSFIPSINDKIKSWQDNIKIDTPDVELNNKNFYGDTDWKTELKNQLRNRFILSNYKPKFVTGAVASSNKLVKSTKLVNTWKINARHIGTVEMELAGVYKAARKINNEFPILSIRGISDIVGFRRDNGWTKFACQSAASFAYTLLKSGLVKEAVVKPKESPFDNNEIRNTIGDTLDIIQNVIEIIENTETFYSDQSELVYDELKKVFRVLNIYLKSLSSSDNKSYAQKILAINLNKSLIRIQNEMNDLFKLTRNDNNSNIDEQHYLIRKDLIESLLKLKDLAGDVINLTDH